VVVMLAVMTGEVEVVVVPAVMMGEAEVMVVPAVAAAAVVEMMVVLAVVAGKGEEVVIAAVEMVVLSAVAAVPAAAVASISHCERHLCCEIAVDPSPVQDAPTGDRRHVAAVDVRAAVRHDRLAEAALLEEGAAPLACPDGDAQEEGELKRDPDIPGLDDLTVGPDHATGHFAGARAVGRHRKLRIEVDRHTMVEHRDTSARLNRLRRGGDGACSAPGYGMYRMA